MHRLTHMHEWLCLYIYSPMHVQTLNMVLHKQKYFLSAHSTQTSLLLSHNEPAPPWSWKTSQKMNVFGTFFVFPLSLSSESFSVPLDARTNFCVFLFERVQAAQINGRVAENLITRHYEAEILLWLLCIVTCACTWNNAGAVEHHVRSFSVQWNQSHTSSWNKNKHLDFHSFWGGGVLIVAKFFVVCML